MKDAGLSGEPLRLTELRLCSVLMFLQGRRTLRRCFVLLAESSEARFEAPPALYGTTALTSLHVPRRVQLTNENLRD